MEETLNIFRKEIGDMCFEIEERMKELGDEDIMTYRSDPVIKEKIAELISLYREAVAACKTYHEAFKVTETFKEYPECIKHLLLSEERAWGISSPIHLITIEFDTDSSHGFEKIYRLHKNFGPPVFELNRGKSATVIIPVSSVQNRPLQISMKSIDGLPSGVTAKLNPESFTIKPHGHTKLELKIIASTTAPISIQEESKHINPETGEIIPAQFIALVFECNGFGIGTGFLIQISE